MSNKINNNSNCELRRRRTIYEDVSLLVIDNPLFYSHSEEKDIHLKFVDYCFVYRCTNVSQCMKYLKKTSRQEYIVVIMLNFDSEKTKTTISQLNRYEQIRAFFTLHRNSHTDDIVCESTIKDEKSCLHKSGSRQTKSFSEYELLLTDVQQFITNIKNNLNDVGLFTTCNSSEKALRDLGRELGSFVWTHTFRGEHLDFRYFSIVEEIKTFLVLLVAMPHNSSEAKRQMLRKCRRDYCNNPFEKKKIDEFEKTYRPCDAIGWYTKPGFLSILVNKNLRSQNAYALYIFRYFIFDLCNELALRKYSNLKPISVYRGAILYRDEIEGLQIGSLVSTNGFLSSSRYREVALSFINLTNSGINTSINRHRTDFQQLVLFQIDIDLKECPDVIVADINGISHIPDEHEFLFDLGTTFVISKISYDEECCLWNVQMTVSNRVAQLNRQYDSYMRERLSETNATILFGRMLAHLSEYSLGIKYFQRLLRVLPTEHEERPGIHYQLARMYRFLGKHKQAIHYFQCAKLLQRRNLPCNSYEYGMTLAGLGTVYLELNDSKRAVPVLEQASIYYNLLSQKYNTETMFHFNRLSYAYYLEKQNERALHLLDKTLLIYKEKMPVDHPGHAQAYHNLGLVHRAMGNMNDALVAYKEALRMREALLAPYHPYIARTCYQIGLLLEESEDYHVGHEYAKRALHIQELKLPSNHHELTLTNELVKRLSSRIHVAT